MQETASTFQIIRGTIILLVVIAGGGWLLVNSLKRSEDPPKLLFKWLLTAVMICLMYWKVAPIVGAGGYGAAFVGIPLTATCGLVLAIIWRYSIASMFAKPFSAIYDGGTAEIEPRPYYSIAEAKRKKGLYTQAIAEIRKQLAKFPTDFQGQLMLAEIQAENMNDLPGAEITLHRLCEQPGHAQRNIAFALSSIADWHLRYTKDRNAAQGALEKIIQMYPDTEVANVASQRIAHLASTERLLEPHDRQRLRVPEGIKNIGLLQSSTHLAPGEGNPAEQAAKYVNHLEQHPFDTEAREKLAVIYANHYERLDLAADQLDQLIEQPNQPAKSVVRWLNLLADLQIKHGVDYDAVHETMERIAERYPNLPAADMARNRMNLLKLELKGKEKNQAVKLGSYEQDIGLKQGLPRQL